MEYIEIFDENNNPTGEIKEKQQAHEDGNYHRTAHIWIINDRNELLLQKRSANKKSHPNCWDISGAGHIRAGETVIDGAIRELKEELGVEIKTHELEFISIIKSTKNSKNMEFAYVYLLHLNKGINEYIFEDNEVSEVKYIHYKKLEQMAMEKVDGLLIHSEEFEKLFNYIEKFKENSMKLKFQIVTEDNIKLAIQIQNSIFPEEDGKENYVECVNKDSYRKEMTYWIVYDKDESIGIGGLYSYNEYPEDAWLGWFGVLSNKRNKGYGNKILEHFENFAKAEGYKNIRLYTDEIDNTNAIKLYTKRGMIKERYTNANEDECCTKTTLIFSKSLTNDATMLWNNKYLGLTEQLEKENKNLIDVCDENGIPTGEKENIVELHKDGKWHKVVGIIIYDKNNKILMQRRALKEKSDAGKWDIAAAGHVDSGETEIQAILRETKEEIGVKLSLEQLELFMTYKKEVKNDKVNKKHLEYIYIAKIENIVEQSLKIQNKEVEQVKLLTIDEVEKLVNEGKVKTRDNMYKKLFELLSRNKKI